jgi:hypothetical protein
MERKTPLGRSEPDSLAPIQLEPIGVDEEVAQMKGGRGSQLTIIMLAGALGLAGTVQWLNKVDNARSYAVASERLEAVEHQHGTAFLRCALPEVQPTQISDRQALHTAIEVASDRFDKYYGRQLQKCTYLLDELQSQLAALDTPADMRRGLTALRVAGQNLGDAWETYRDYLQDPKQRYDYVQATPLIEKITLAWEAYQQQEASLQQALRKRQ